MISKKVFQSIFLSASVLLLSFSSAYSQEITVGAERQSEYLHLLEDKRVGLLVNPTSMVAKDHLVDSLIKANVKISLIFAPEHGFRGKHGAGETVANSRDPKTGIDIISLHGKIKKPTSNQLSQVDILIFDIQDVGVRYFTYVSSMHYFMESCAENNTPLIILDRPNPNGDYIDGPVLQMQFSSFVGMHPIPIVHGMTVGELALMINGEKWLTAGRQCELTVIKVANYDHNTRYSLPIKPSPNLPNDLSVRLYPSLGFFEATPVSVGRGTDWPFQVLGFNDKSMGNFRFKPNKIRGSWRELNYAGTYLFGERLERDDVITGIDLGYLIQWNTKFSTSTEDFINRPNFMDKLSGSSSIREMLAANKGAVEIKESWFDELKAFQAKRVKYLLYKDSKIISTRFK